MIRKHDGIAIPEDDPYVNDKLEREQHVLRVSDLTSTITQPFCLALDGPWGSGKTTFVRMLNAELLNRGRQCLCFNAWENDFVLDPLLAFVAEIDQAIAKRTLPAERTSASLAAWENVKRHMQRAVSYVVPAAIRFAPGVVGDPSPLTSQAASAIAQLAGDLLEGDQHHETPELDRYGDAKKALVTFRASVTEFVEAVKADLGNSAFPITIIVDELDRCRPSFALELLERIKHLFCIPGLLFVLAIDKSQLAHMIRAVYGRDTNADGYLRRFVDLTFRLPDPPIEKYTSYLFETFGMTEVMKQRRDPHGERQVLLGVLNDWSCIFEFSLRTVEQCFSRLNLAIRLADPKAILVPRSLAFLIALQGWNAHVYDRFASGRIGTADLMELLGENPAAAAHLGDPRNQRECYQLYWLSGKTNEFAERLSRTQGIVADESKGNEEKQAASEELACYQSLSNTYHFLSRRGVVLPYLSGLIDATKDFKET